MSGVVTIEQMQTGTYTIKVHHDGAVVHRRAGVSTHAEALVRARVWCRECGYDLDDRVPRLPPQGADILSRMANKVPDTAIKAMISEEKAAIEDGREPEPVTVADSDGEEVNQSQADYLAALRKAMGNG